MENIIVAISDIDKCQGFSEIIYFTQPWTVAFYEKYFTDSSFGFIYCSCVVYEGSGYRREIFPVENIDT